MRPPRAEGSKGNRCGSQRGGGEGEVVSTYSRTVWVCNGCRYGLLMAAGVVPSDAGWGGSDIFARGLVGLKRPGDEAGVLLAVLEGI